MKAIDKERKLCTCCMEEHDVQRIVIRENNTFKGVPVEYDAEYFYCDKATRPMPMSSRSPQMTSP